MQVPKSHLYRLPQLCIRKLRLMPFREELAGATAEILAHPNLVHCAQYPKRPTSGPRMRPQPCRARGTASRGRSAGCGIPVRPTASLSSTLKSPPAGLVHKSQTLAGGSVRVLRLSHLAHWPSRWQAGPGSGRVGACQ